MSVQQALELMLQNKVGRLPILDDGELESIVTDKDLMRWVLRVNPTYQDTYKLFYIPGNPSSHIQEQPL